jgi:hypothetical protein
MTVEQMHAAMRAAGRKQGFTEEQMDAAERGL